MSDVFTVTVDKRNRLALSTTIENLINMLDDLDPDPELEDGADGEPSLAGWAGCGDDRECDEADDEHSLGWTEEGSQTGDLGCFFGGDDQEPDLGFVGIGTGWRKGEDVKDLGEHVDEREPNGDEEDGSSHEDFGGSDMGGNGSGHEIARKMLREHARRLPSGDIVREIKPLTGSAAAPVLLDPEAMDLRAHYWAAKGF